MKHLFLLVLLLVGLATPVSAADQVIETVGEYLVGDGETMAAGLEYARKDAIRRAAEQAGTYVRSYSKVRNLALEDDLIEVVANHAMKITTLPETRQMAGNAIKILVPIRAEIMAGEVERTIQRTLQQRQEVGEYRQLQARLQLQSQELNELKKQLADAATADKQKIVDRISEQERSVRAAGIMKDAGELAFRKQFAESRLLLSKVIELTPHDPQAYLRRALVSVAPEQQDEVGRDIAMVLKLDAKQGPVLAEKVYFKRADYYLGSDTPNQALVEADKGVAVLKETLPKEYEPYLRFLMQSRKMTNVQQTLELFCKSFSVAPCTEEHIMTTPQAAAIRQLDTSDALQALAQAYYERAKIRYELGDVNGALQDQQQSCALPAYVTVADFCEPTGLFKPFRSAAALKAYQFVQQGVRAFGAGNAQQGLLRFDAAIGLEPDNKEAWYYRGYTLLWLNRAKEALVALNQLVQLAPHEARSYDWRSRARAILGDHRGALADLEKAVKLAPQDPELLLHLARQYEQVQQPDKAAATYLRYARSYADNPGMALQTARELQRMARKVEERQLLEEFLRQVQKNPQNYGSDQQLAEDIAQAKERLQQLQQ